MFTVLNNQKNSFHYHLLDLSTCDYYIVDVSKMQHNTVYIKIEMNFTF